MQVLHLFPVDHVGIEVQTEAVNQALNVAHRLVSVPACVHVEQQWSQAHDSLGDVGGIRAVKTAAQTDDAVEILAFAMFFDFFCERHQFGLAARAGVPIGLDLAVEVGAVLANTLLIERNIRIRGVHDA
ncbi:hypothetical protein D3C76_746050 [compost metagenome]